MARRIQSSKRCQRFGSTSSFLQMPEHRLKLFKRLERKLSLSQNIRYIYIPSDIIMDRYTSCLKRAFTPNVKTIDGDFDAPFYNLLLRTAQHATGDFKLEPLPSPFAWKTIHLETFLCFKESLKCLELNLNSSDEHAVQKSILDRVPMMEKTELDEWMMSQVKKDTSLQTLALDGSNNPSVVKYLLQKYPNATSVEIASMEAYSVSPSSSSLPKLDAIKGLDHSSVDEWVVDSLQAMKALVSAMESQKNSMLVYRENIRNSMTDKQTSQVFEELVSLVPFTTASSTRG
ncbi:hypothetical protein G6F42_011264 [Rhizopus arrhizus]|nr:hypothetical protein G6F42_011264 [Rhizopus arrhizus]